ncbi:MAG: UDP-N-acetylmuramyl-tripeptide synthetase [Mariprofundales bacterium]
MSRVMLLSPTEWVVDDDALMIAAVADDSRAVESGDLFLLLPHAGSRQLDAADDGYLRQAIARGAAAVVSVGAAGLFVDGVSIPHLALATMEEAGLLLRRLLGSATTATACIGVTGTDGKTSIAWMVRAALQRLHGSSWSLGTLGKITQDGSCLPLANTTPSLLTMQQVLAEASAAQVKGLVCEVSSHGIAQQRIAGIPFSVALWSNIGHDHLQDHGGMDRYLELKTRFVRRVADQGGVAIANADQSMVVMALEDVRSRIFWYGREFGEHCPDNHLCWRSLSVDQVELQCGGQKQVVEGVPAAEFHHENLAAAAALLLYGEFAEFAQLPSLLSSITAPPGRMEPVTDGVFVDYAHTPEALAALLASARKLCSGRLLLVFGCGGDRDHSKRAQMGEVAARGADAVWVTEDNSRSESPQKIVDQVVLGIDTSVCQMETVVDRGAAIVAALDSKSSDDLLLIAGKGHENYIERNGVRTPWSDAGCVRDYLLSQPKRSSCE